MYECLFAYAQTHSLKIFLGQANNLLLILKEILLVS